MFMHLNTAFSATDRESGVSGNLRMERLRETSAFSFTQSEAGMKDILLLVRDDAGQPARVQVAVSVARLLEATVTCIKIDQVSAERHDEDGELLNEAIRHQSDANQKMIDNLFAERSINHQWVAARGSLIDRLIEQAAFHDLLIVNTHMSDHARGDSSFVVSQLVRAIDQPLLLVPDGLIAEDFGAHATIAWDGSRPCIAAMRAAVPLLRKAKIVKMIEFGRHRGGPTIDRAAVYLRNQGIMVHTTHDESLHDPVHWLISRCRPGRTSYCVMGAFGHSRSREAVFGGVTLAMLEQAKIPLFVAH
jgi:hypothetical protein